MAGTVLKGHRTLPFFFAMAGCQRHCIYCDQSSITGKSAAPSPDDIRRCLESLEKPVEMAFFGGSFTCLPTRLIEDYLEAAATAPRGSTLRFSTHPLCLSTGLLDKIKAISSGRCPISCIELGISSLDDQVLETCLRGYSGKQALGALSSLMEAGFPAGAQLMVGLPGQDEASTLNDIRLLARLKGPLSMDLRLYPCLVISGTPLEKLWLRQKYLPLETETAAIWTGRLLLEAMDLGFNVLRVGLAETETLASSVKAGPHHPAFGELAWGECHARLLTRNSPSGPWTEHRKQQSLFAGHGQWGMERLAALSGKRKPKAQTLLSFWPPLHSRKKD
jgi:histone acetyltransferase (RNA polymerase elongator complex component)